MGTGSIHRTKRPRCSSPPRSRPVRSRGLACRGSGWSSQVPAPDPATMTLTAGSGAVGSAALRTHDDGGGALTGRSAAVRAEWHELFVAEYPRLAGWTRRLVQDDEIAHEIASESFTRLMARWERSDNPHAYLY